MRRLSRPTLTLLVLLSSLLLPAAAGAKAIYGTDGNDVLIGTAADEGISAGRGNDVIDGGGGRDTMMGGIGFDIVLYNTRTAPVKVTLAGTWPVGCFIYDFDNCGRVADDGEFQKKEVDDVRNDTEGVVGGSGPDTLIGSNKDNLLIGGLGTDILKGEGGNDVIDARDGRADTLISCGAGRDTLLADTTDPIPTNCEVRG